MRLSPSSSNQKDGFAFATADSFEFLQIIERVRVAKVVGRTFSGVATAACRSRGGVCGIVDFPHIFWTEEGLGVLL
jgi:hypothetical protein